MVAVGQEREGGWERQTDRQTDRQTETKTQTDRQTGLFTCYTVFYIGYMLQLF